MTCFNLFQICVSNGGDQGRPEPFGPPNDQKKTSFDPNSLLVTKKKVQTALVVIGLYDCVVYVFASVLLTIFAFHNVLFLLINKINKYCIFQF